MGYFARSLWILFIGLGLFMQKKTRNKPNHGLIFLIRCVHLFRQPLNSEIYSAIFTSSLLQDTKCTYIAILLHPVFTIYLCNNQFFFTGCFLHQNPILWNASLQDGFLVFFLFFLDFGLLFRCVTAVRWLFRSSFRFHFFGNIQD